MIFRSTLVALCGFTLLSGCSSEPARPKTYPVSGTVTFKDRPLDNARVVFVPKTPGVQPASGVTDKDGKYQLTTFESNDGAQAGDYLVKVAKYDGNAPPAPADTKPISYEEEQKLEFAPDEKPHPVAKSVLPKKYDNEGTSGLKHTVTEGPTTFDIKVE